MGGWLRSILHNLHIDALRRQRRQGMKVDLSEVDNSIAAMVPPRDHAAMLDMDRAMASLSLEHRQILLLVGLEGLNYREAAVDLDVPIGPVMSRLARARERRRAALAGARGPSLRPGPSALPSAVPSAFPGAVSDMVKS